LPQSHAINVLVRVMSVKGFYCICCKGQQNQRACGSVYMQSFCATLDVKGTGEDGVMLGLQEDHEN